MFYLRVFVTILTEVSMQDTTVARLPYRVQAYRLPSPLSFKYNVLRESLFEDSQNIWVIFSVGS